MHWGICMKFKVIAAISLVTVIIVIATGTKLYANMKSGHSIETSIAKEQKGVAYYTEKIKKIPVLEQLLYKNDYKEMLANICSMAETALAEEDNEEDAELDVEEIEDIDLMISENDEKTVHDIITGEDGSVEKEYLVENAAFNEGLVDSRSAQLSVSNLMQLPELPTGCEITSLTTVLNYFGYSVSKGTMADNYLPKSDLNEGSFWHYFIGNPRDEYAYGCYAEPIVAAANAYLSANGGSHCAYEYSGSDFSTLLNEVADGNPVVLWSTMGLMPAYTTRKWVINGETIHWTAPEHCVVLIGYNLDAGTALISDPLVGIVERDLNTVVSRYHQMYSQAVVIKSTEQHGTVNPEPASEPKPQPEPATEPKTQPEPVTEPKTQPEPEPQSETQEETQPESQSESQLEPKSGPVSQQQSKAQPASHM